MSAPVAYARQQDGGCHGRRQDERDEETAHRLRSVRRERRLGAGRSYPPASTMLIGSGSTPSVSASWVPRGVVIGIHISAASSAVANARSRSR